MGSQLKMSDLNALLDAEEERGGSKPTPKASEPVKLSTPKPKVDRTEELIAARPSAFQAEHRQRLRQKKVLSFGQVPAFIAEGFERLAAEAGMTKRAYLYQLLREKGLDIPSQDLMDGRRL